jgi:hypothetical protein
LNGKDTIVWNDNVNIQKFSGFDQYSLIQKFTFRPSDNLNFNYGFYLGITRYIGKNIQIHAIGFYTWLRDAMVRRDSRFNGHDSLVYDGVLRKVQALVNTGKAKIYGFSVVF